MSIHKNHYIDKKEFHECFVRWHAKKVDGELPPVPNDIAEGFYALATNIAKANRFSGYTWYEDLIGYALMICVRYAHNYNPEKSNEAFDYFSRTIRHAFFQENAKQKKQQEVITNYNTFADSYVNSEFHDLNFVPQTVDELRRNQDDLEYNKSTY